jgi:hypothetical protein
VYQELIKANAKPIIKENLNEYFDAIASYSNNHFLSSDTIPPSKYQLPKISFPDAPEIGSDGVLRYFLLGYDENGGLFHLAKQEVNWRFQTGLNNYTLKNDIVLNDYWQRLSKKAVLTSAGVVDLFFREVAKAQSDHNFIKDNESNLFLAAIKGINGFINNIFQKQPDYVVQDNNIIPTSKSNQSTTTILPIITTTKPPVVTNTANITKFSTTTTKQVITTTTTKLKTTTTTTPKSTTITTTTKPLSLCSFNINQIPLRTSIIINELAWMGTTNSANDEWIELRNISSETIDMSGWRLLDQDDQINIIFPLDTVIVPGQIFLLERTDDNTVSARSADLIYVGNLSNQNEGLRLFNNSCQSQDEALANPEWLAGDNVSKRTMERKSDFSWQTSALINGTPKQENSSGYVLVNSGGSSNVPNTTTTTITTSTTIQTTTTTITTTTKPNYAKILITEIRVAGLSSDGKTNVYDEFIELYNSNNFEVNLTGWYLQKKTSQSNEFSSLVPSDLFEGKIINPSEYFLISHSSSTYQDIADILDSNYSVTDNNTIVLKNPNREIVDKVGFGEANDCEVTCVLNPDLGKSIQRKYINEDFIDTDDNFNDFEIQNCPSPKSLEAECQNPLSTTTTTLPASPSVPYITEFSWHPFEKNSSKVVIDFRTNSYPFIPSTNYTDNVFTAMAFYLHSDKDDPSSNFGIPTDYLGDQDNWSLGGIPSLVLSFPNCQGYTGGSSALVFTNSESWCHAPGGSRGLSYNWWQLPEDNHFLVDVIGITNGQGLNFTPDQYVTIGYYGYDNSLRSYLKLIAYDPTKFYFDSANHYHQPTNVLNFEAKCDNDSCNNLIFSWISSSDEDPKDILQYDFHYVFAKQGDDLNNNDLVRQSWEWSASQNVLGGPTFDPETNKFSLQVSINDLYYIKEKRLPGVPLDVFFGIKAQDNEGLKSEISKIVFLNIPSIAP